MGRDCVPLFVAYQIPLHVIQISHNKCVANTYKQGEHICSIYETEEEQLAVAAEYLSDGLRNGEREQVTDYEAILNPFFKNVRGAGMCLYQAYDSRVGRARTSR